MTGVVGVARVEAGSPEGVLVSPATKWKDLNMQTM